MSGQVLVTGASGMLGRATVSRLRADGIDVRPVGHETRGSKMISWQLGTPLGSALAGVDVVVHLAARVHVRGRGYTNAAEFERANADAVLRLAEESLRYGVRRFVFMSSIGVLGSDASRPLAENGIYRPQSAYARSKQRAEEKLFEFRASTGMEITVLRPPAVIGPNAKGNVRTVMAAVRRRIPLPLASISNRRQFIGLRDLVEAIVLAVTREAAGDDIFNVAHDQPVSTPELCRMIGAALGTKANLWPLPVAWLRAGLIAVGRRSLADGLTRDLLIDTSRASARLGWAPRQSLMASIKEAVTGELNE